MYPRSNGRAELDARPRNFGELNYPQVEGAKLREYMIPIWALTSGGIAKAGIGGRMVGGDLAVVNMGTGVVRSLT